MYKLKKISKKLFDDYTEKIKKNHFMQTTSWGEYDKITKYSNPNYIGFVDNNKKIVGVALIIEQYMVGKYTCLYIPYGPVIDFENTELIKNFINQIKDYAKSKNAYIIKFNPYTEKNKRLNSLLLKNGLKENKQNKNINYRINLQKSNLSNRSIQDLLKTYDYYSIETTINPTIEKVSDIINEDNKMLFEIFREDNKCPINLFIITLHITKTIKNIEKELMKINNQISIIPIDHLDQELKLKLKTLKESKYRLEEELKKFKQYKLDYGTTYIINTNLMIEQDQQIWPILNITNNINEDILEFLIYYEYINYYKNYDYKYLYLLNPIEKTKELNNYQKLFVPEIIEYESEYYLITKKLINLIAKIKNK